MYLCMCVDIYPDDTRTVPVSTSVHVYWCGNVGAQSRSVTTVSTNKHQQTVYMGHWIFHENCHNFGEGPLINESVIGQ